MREKACSLGSHLRHTEEVHFQTSGDECWELDPSCFSAISVVNPLTAWKKPPQIARARCRSDWRHCAWPSTGAQRKVAPAKWSAAYSLYAFVQPETNPQPSTLLWLQLPSCRCDPPHPIAGKLAAHWPTNNTIQSSQQGMNDAEFGGPAKIRWEESRTL